MWMRNYCSRSGSLSSLPKTVTTRARISCTEILDFGIYDQQPKGFGQLQFSEQIRRSQTGLRYGHFGLLSRRQFDGEDGVLKRMDPIGHLMVSHLTSLRL